MFLRHFQLLSWYCFSLPLSISCIPSTLIQQLWSVFYIFFPTQVIFLLSFLQRTEHCLNSPYIFFFCCYWRVFVICAHILTKESFLSRTGIWSKNGMKIFPDSSLLLYLAVLKSPSAHENLCFLEVLPLALPWQVGQRLRLSAGTFSSLF